MMNRLLQWLKGGLKGRPHPTKKMIILRVVKDSDVQDNALPEDKKCGTDFINKVKTLKNKKCGTDFIRKVNNIMEKHSGTHTKKFKLGCVYGARADIRRLNSWLKIVFTPGIEEITLYSPNKKYNFPCSLLSDGVRNSVRRLKLSSCAFHPTIELGPFKSLTRLHLSCLRITGDELECLLSNSLGLEQLQIMDCDKIIFLEVPCLLQQLSRLVVLDCDKMEVMKSNAPNISAFEFATTNQVQVELLLGESLKLKEIDIWGDFICYACSKFPSSVPNLGSLTITSSEEVGNTQMLPTKFLYLKHLSITIDPDCYDCFSLVSLLDASPSLETFSLELQILLEEFGEMYTSIFDESPDMRQVTKCRYDKLKSVNITRFSSLKSVVELTCHIVENSMSLECLTLDTTDGYGRCCATNFDSCLYKSCDGLLEDPKALLAVETFIEGKVPSTVNLCVIESCHRSHVVGHGSS